jgi:hypothetical protein
MKASTLKNIIKLATARRATQFKKLAIAQSNRDDAKCVHIYSCIAQENEIIENAEHALKYAM